MYQQDFFALEALSGPDRLEAALATAEAALHVHLTLHDHAGIFLAADGTPALPDARRRHKRPLCNAGRQRPDWDQACLAQCAEAVPDQAAARLEPFIHCCWKGAAELVIPLLHEGAHVGTLFAGQWRTRDIRDPSLPELPAKVAALRAELPAFDHARIHACAGPLTLLGTGLIRWWLDHLGWGDNSDRGAAIRRYLHLHLHEPALSLTSLARHLGLSSSRSGQLIRDYCGAPFQTVVATSRIRRAQALLRHTRRSVKLIAERVGFSNEYYFNRAFTQLVGCPPGRWRRGAKLPDQG